MTKEEFDENKRNEYNQTVIDFFESTNALSVTFENNILNLADYKFNTQLEFINFGEGKLTLEESGLSELAIDTDYDPHLMSKLNSLKGKLNIVPINKHIVFHNPESDRVLVARPC